MNRAPYITIVFTLLAAGIYAAAGTPAALVYRADAPSVLSLLSCHLVHWSAEHLFWDALSFAAVGAWCERIHRKGYAVFLLSAALIIPPSAIALTPGINTYAGFSGIDMGQAAFAVSVLLHRFFVAREWRRAGGVALAAATAVGKLGYEFGTGSTLFVSAAPSVFVPVPAAHLIGVLSGAAVGVFVLWGTGVRPPGSSPSPTPRSFPTFYIASRG